MNVFIKPALCLAALMVLPLAAPQVSHAQFAFGGDAPIKIDADKIEYEGAVTILTGQVEVIQEGTRILSDRMELRREQLANGRLGDVTRIDATGSFYYIAPDQKIRGQKGVYIKASDTIIVTGNVIIGDDTGNVGTTERFVYNLISREAVLEGTCKGRACTSGRPSIIINQNSNDSNPG
ncbi:MAG: LptA/OstA family protein [Robiginitomaculum sp.]